MIVDPGYFDFTVAGLLIGIAAQIEETPLREIGMGGVAFKFLVESVTQCLGQIGGRIIAVVPGVNSLTRFALGTERLGPETDAVNGMRIWDRDANGFAECGIDVSNIDQTLVAAYVPGVAAENLACQERINGTCRPLSLLPPLQPGYSVPSGNTCVKGSLVPLSPMTMTRVLSRKPCSSSLSMTLPMSLSI